MSRKLYTPPEPARTIDPATLPPCPSGAWITCACGHMADMDDFIFSRLGVEFPRGSYQCRKCGVAWKTVRDAGRWHQPNLNYPPVWIAGDARTVLIDPPFMRSRFNTPKGLTSPNPTCRRLGCRASVPPEGYYNGMPQSHCPYCGTRTTQACEGCTDFVEPSYPLVHLRDRIAVTWKAAKDLLPRCWGITCKSLRTVWLVWKKPVENRPVARNERKPESARPVA